MRVFLLATTAALAVTPVFAADTPVAVPAVEPQPVHYGEMRGSHDPWEGFYVKGQVGYLWPEFRGATYAVTGGTSGFETGELDNTWAAGIGAGFQVNRYLRTELMFDYIFDSDFYGSTVGQCGVGPGGALVDCTSTDTTSWNAYTLMASLYVDLDFWEHHSAWGHIVPFVGGGIGGSYVNWDRLNNTACEIADPTNCETIYHEGESSWRFAWQVEAGASYYFRCDFAGEASYRYRRIGEGGMFGYASSTGPGHDQGINVQSVNLGLRYYPGRDCEPPYVPPHVPPVYK
ncbi:outer membrane protein [Hoeflea prorocentri]|uniref:Outer membrane beta-barrel protein n=1 Tax=Hoeflea prorocentri TaxID=1922333 RepID=A0A9X3UDJ9_9HYPH|nr:outer membrane beta-barrel protein [Hoeflea prorocentri]MCY6379321.1 outer membrane beta-barrel protein [Hoeflea prorocentri]MDA5397122.1 outer membrane beta-barrel protein [Hoeflea prorocentri]